MLIMKINQHHMVEWMEEIQSTSGNNLIILQENNPCLSEIFNLVVSESETKVVTMYVLLQTK